MQVGPTKVKRYYKLLFLFMSRFKKISFKINGLIFLVLRECKHNFKIVSYYIFTLSSTISDSKSSLTLKHVGNYNKKR